MDADTLVAVGDFCENLLNETHFQFVAAYFEQNLLAEMLATKAHEAKAREFIYAKIMAHREFLSSLANFVKEKDEARKPHQDHLDDDPSVHNIYE
jgi:hypothetical protein